MSHDAIIRRDHIPIHWPRQRPSQPRRGDVIVMGMVAGGRDSSSLFASFKSIASPLLDGGKALGRCGECIIDMTNDLDIYGGGISLCGAQVRNAGDCLAQAAASCRFKTGYELIIDEIREAATCLKEGYVKIKQNAIPEAKFDRNDTLEEILRSLEPLLLDCSTLLEGIGEGFMKRMTLGTMGTLFVQLGQKMAQVSLLLGQISSSSGQEASQYMKIASDKMQIVGMLLLPPNPSTKAKPTTGRSFLKGGGSGQ